MARHILYILLLVGVTLYAAIRGGPPEKIGGATVAIGTLLTVLVASTFSQRFRHVEDGIFAVDTAIVMIFIWLSVRSTRFWPIWVAALQTITVGVHLMRENIPEIVPQAYMDAVSSSSYPILLLIAAGTWRHCRRRSLTGADAPWKSPARHAVRSISPD